MFTTYQLVIRISQPSSSYPSLRNLQVQLQELKQQLRHLAPTAVGAGSPMGSPTSPRPPTPATTPVSNA
jgi:hypothetical protein